MPRKWAVVESALYITDNGALLCGSHLGASAKATGHDISGQKVSRVTSADAKSFTAQTGEPPKCERCGVSVDTTITAEDARMWGREAHGMGLTLARAIEDIVQCGCPDRLLPEVSSAYERARRESIHSDA